MVLIFGWGAGEAQDLGEVAPATCPNCHNEVFLHHIRSDKRVSLYFVPLFPYGSNEYLACPICRSGIQLEPKHGPAVAAMKGSTALIRRAAMAPELYRVKVERFWRTLGVAPSGQQVLQAAQGVLEPVAPAPAAAATSAPRVTLAQQLQALAQLHEQGVLSEEEFASAKSRLLAT
jgi:hypothetical protein